MKTIVIYSPENDESVNKVKDFKARHPKFEFLTVDDTDAIKLAKAGIKNGNKIIELDKPKKAKASEGGSEKKEPTLSEKILKKLGKKSMTSEEIVDALPKSLNSNSIKSAITRMVGKEVLTKTKKGNKTLYKAK